MAICVDTSVLVAASHRAHPQHQAALTWLKRTTARTEVVASTHALAELYGTLTRTGARGMFRLAPRDAERIVTRLRRRLRIIPLSATDYREAISVAVDRGITGATFYDALHAQAARKAGANRIATFNLDDFRKVWAPSQLIVP